MPGSVLTRICSTIQKFPVNRIIAVGKSMGGRVASQMVAEGLMDVAGLIFLGYPLHAPGKKDQLRDAHLYRIRVPMLFFAGSKDPLCNMDKLNTVLDNLPSYHDLEIIEGGNHSFNLPKSFSLFGSRRASENFGKMCRVARGNANSANRGL